MENQLKCQTAYLILLTQLIAMLIHYPCTFALPGLTDWSAFLEPVMPTMWSHNCDNGLTEGAKMDGMRLMFIPVLVRHLLGPLACLSLWPDLLNSQMLQTIERYNEPPAAQSPPYTCNSWYYSSYENVTQNPPVLDSYLLR